MANYSIALAEVDEILNYVEASYISKIPNDILDIIKTGKSENIDFKYNPTQKLSEQKVHKETLEKIYHDNFNKIEEEKRAKYNPDDLFKNVKTEKKEELPVVIEKKANFFTKFIEKIKAIIKR